jgi:hypothetical protein
MKDNNTNEHMLHVQEDVLGKPPNVDSDYLIKKAKEDLKKYMKYALLGNLLIIIIALMWAYYKKAPILHDPNIIWILISIFIVTIIGTICRTWYLYSNKFKEIEEIRNKEIDFNLHEYKDNKSSNKPLS